MPSKPKTPAKPTVSNKELEDLLNSSAASPEAAPPSVQTEDEGDEVDSSPAVNLDPSVFLTLDDVPPGAFSDEPPPGFAPMPHKVVGMDVAPQPDYTPPPPPTGPTPDPRPDLRAAPGNVFPKSGYFASSRDKAPDPNAPDPKYNPNDVNAARASLLEDADRARAAASLSKAAPGPSVPTGAPRRPNADLAVQRALQAHETASQAQSGNTSSVPQDQQYRSRISVSTAYRYDGAVRTAPPFIDRNWAAYDNGGPALNIPNVGLLHVGEWLVIQDILDDDGSIALTEFKIYDDYSFHSMFMPTEAAA